MPSFILTHLIFVKKGRPSISLFLSPAPEIWGWLHHHNRSLSLPDLDYTFWLPIRVSVIKNGAPRSWFPLCSFSFPWFGCNHHLTQLPAWWRLNLDRYKTDNLVRKGVEDTVNPGHRKRQRVLGTPKERRDRNLRHRLTPFSPHHTSQWCSDDGFLSFSLSHVKNLSLEYFFFCEILHFSGHFSVSKQARRITQA